MTREREQTGTAAVLPPPPQTATVAPSPRPAPDPVPHRLVWEPWFRAASPAQQGEMLALAQQQGFVFAHQIPPLNGARAAAPPTEPAAANLAQPNLLTKLLAGNSDLRRPTAPQPLTLADTELDAAQREAVARAAASPDVFMLRGRPGAGVSRVLTEIILQACRRGERVLLVAGRTAALDVILRRLAAYPEIAPLRFLDPAEKIEQLAPEVRCLAYSQRCHAFAADTLTRARQAADHSAERLAQRRREEGYWTELESVQQRQEELRQQHERLVAETASLEQKIEEEVAELLNLGQGSTPWAAEVLNLDRTRRADRAALEKQLADFAGQSQRVEQALADLKSNLQKLAPLADAKRRGRWWTWTWWRATFRGNVVAQATQLEAQLAELEKQSADCRRQADQASAQGQAQEQCWQQQQAALLADERRRRNDALQEALHSLGLEEARLLEDRRRLLALLPGGADFGPSAEDIQARRRAWLDARAPEEAQQRFVHDWAGFVADHQDQLAERYPKLANVVAISQTALPNCRPLAGESFDLLVLEEAHHLNDNELSALSRWATRWVLTGDLTEEAGAAGPQRAAVAEPVGLHKLWRQLHPDFSRLTYSWSREGQRWCCTLRPLPQGAVGPLEVEHLADFPEIELRIAPRPTPALTQVVFPATMDLPRAKDFIFRELQEVALQTLFPTCWLQEDENSLTLHLAPHLPAEARSLRLEEGLAEWVAGPATYRLEFSKPQWDPARIENWLARHLHIRDLGRTCCLEKLHRHSPGLAECVGELLFGQRLPGGTTSAAAPGAAVVFVAVPPSRPRDERRKGMNGGPQHQALPREGAGLELDLGAPGRLVERLPADLRADLPRQGIVNLPEAQALVRKLEHWVRGHGTGQLPRLGVIGLYQAQVVLLRRLLERSETLRWLPLEVGTPADFAQRDVDVVFLSLTRSPTQRAVSFGDGPHALAQACTRARRQFFLFGDVGALARRAAWQGQLPPLDQAASHREARLATRLLACIEGRANLGPAFLVEQES